MKDEDVKIDIPEDLQQICREIAMVAQKHGLYSMSGKFQPTGGWSGEISFMYDSGRHGADANEIRISSQFFVHTEVKLSNPTNT